MSDWRDHLRFWQSLLVVQPVVALRCVADHARARRDLPTPPAEPAAEPAAVRAWIALDGRKLGGKTTGLERYSRELVRAVAVSGSGFGCRVYSLQPYDAAEGSAVNVCRPRGSELHRQMARDFAAGRADLLHLPWTDLELTLFVPLLFAPRCVVTVHDLIPLRYYYSPQRRAAYRALLRWALRRADAILADSEHTREDLGRMLGIAGTRVHVVPLGVDPRFRPQAEAETERVRRRYALPPRFALTVGRSFPHKNHPALVGALAQLRRRIPDVELVIAGPEDNLPGRRAVEQAIREADAEAWVRRLDWIDEADLPPLYGAAEVFAFPSLYEGFGLPPLEAMACGTPVVCSNRSSLPEVVGDAGLLVDPGDPEAFAEALRRVVQERGLRQELSWRGIERAARFTWEETARRTLQVYERVLAGRERPRAPE